MNPLITDSVYLRVGNRRQFFFDDLYVYHGGTNVHGTNRKHPLHPYHSPLEGESQKPSRQAKADAVGGGSRDRLTETKSRAGSRVR